MSIPSGPPGVSLDSNMRLAFVQGGHFNQGGDAFLFSWFYSQVKIEVLGISNNEARNTKVLAIFIMALLERPQDFQKKRYCEQLD